MSKRVFDIAIVILLLPVALPIMAITALVIMLSSPGPLLYRGTRTGQFGRPFRILKFRTMMVNAESHGFGYSTANNDARLTRFGKAIRKYKLDELPQLFNVLLGDMSLVGPRPEVEYFTRRYSEEEKVILTVKPGLTDYASIRFINLGELLGDTDIETKYLSEIEPEKTRLRIQYARKHNILIDMKLLVLTVARYLQVILNGISTPRPN